jgi:rod shape determining protein RodA
MKIDRRLIVHFDWVLLGLVLLISLAGILNLYSTGSGFAPAGAKSLYMKQLYWFCAGLGFMLLAAAVDYRFIVRNAYWIYGAILLLLLLVICYGNTIHGSQRWLSLGPVSLQPSEFAKIGLVLVLTRYITDNQAGEAYEIRNLLAPLGILVLPVVLIARQPDLGTALFLVILAASMIFFIGVKRKTILLFASAGVILLPLLWFFLKDYQRERIFTFFNPERDPLGAGYHIIQSVIAIGSGGVLGKGFLKGTQSQLKFLPEQQTDFVFSVFAEEWGFAGVLVLMALFLFLLLWGIKIARNSRDLAGTLIAFGVTAMIFWGVFINICMVIGVLPVVGIPLPFFSYGGSSMAAMMAGIGLLMNVSMRRYILQP